MVVKVYDHFINFIPCSNIAAYAFDNGEIIRIWRAAYRSSPISFERCGKEQQQQPFNYESESEANILGDNINHFFDLRFSAFVLCLCTFSKR